MLNYMIFLKICGLINLKNTLLTILLSIVISLLLSVKIQPILSKPKEFAIFSSYGSNGSISNSTELIFPFCGGS